MDDHSIIHICARAKLVRVSAASYHLLIHQAGLYYSIFVKDNAIGMPRSIFPDYGTSHSFAIHIRQLLRKTVQYSKGFAKEVEQRSLLEVCFLESMFFLGCKCLLSRRGLSICILSQIFLSVNLYYISFGILLN